MRLLWSILCLLPIVLCEVDTKWSAEPINMTLRDGQYANVSLPLKFDIIKQIKVGPTYDADGNLVNNPVAICAATDPEIKLNSSYAVNFDGYRPYKDIVVSYEELLNEQSVLDVTVYEELLYLCFESGEVRVFSIDKNLVTPIRSIRNPAITNLSQGYFVAGKQGLFFFNDAHAFLVKENELVELNSYKADNFESAVYVPEQDAFVVACGIQGLKVFILQEYQVTNIYTFAYNKASPDSGFFKFPVEISDVANSGSDLYLLNRNSTVMILTLNIGDLKHSKLKISNLGKLKCENLALQDKKLYVSCPEVYVYDLTPNFPVLLFSYKHPRFTVKNLLPAEDLTILTSQNLIRLYFRDMEIMMAQDFELDRIFYYKGTLFLVSEYGIITSKWTFQTPLVTCGLPSTSTVEGSHSTVLSVYAECDKRYTNNQTSYSTLVNETTCVYHFPVYIDFWVGRSINLMPFYAISLIVLFSLIGLGGVVVFVKKQFNQIKTALSSLADRKKQAQGYDKMVEDPDPQTVHQNGEPQFAQVNQKTDNPHQESEQKFGHQLHDIE